MSNAPKTVDQRVHRAGFAADEQFLRQPRILALARTGIAFVVPWSLARCGHSISVIAEPERRADQLFGAFRQWSPTGGVQVIPADTSSLVRARNALRTGKHVVIYPEFASGPGKRQNVSFLRTDLAVPLGAATLAFRTETPVIPVFAYSRDGNVVVDAAEPLDPTQFEDPAALNTALFKSLASFIIAHPEQWLGWREQATSRRPSGDAR